MKNRLDVRKALRVCDKATRFGRKGADNYELDGLKVRPHFDGYTVTVSDPQTSLHLHFHNRYQIHSEDGRAMDAFIERLDLIDQRY
ncbi:DUF3081 family protein [Ferrimonas pelagia]|uniref:DUF3081 domain-containing protein n=1 Tax=Ferrimonas pelagia TaxID=1177826 RepID=A0ABP9FBT1_9GAMM